MKKGKITKVILTSFITVFMLMTSTLRQVDAAASQIITSYSTTEKVAAITFDDFAGNEAQAMLTVLNTYGVRASFFLLGSSIEAHPDLVQQLVAAGNFIGNHSYDHPYLSDLSATEILEQLQETESIIQSVTGKSSMPYFRPPYGDYDDSVLQVAGDAGFTKTVLWTVDSMDYDGISKEEIISNVVDNVVPGSIILMHTGGSATNTQFALETIITTLQSQGYSFATIPELFGETVAVPPPDPVVDPDPDPVIDPDPDPVVDPDPVAPTVAPTLSYSAHIQSIGWQSYVSEGTLAGTTGLAKRIEALKANIDPGSYSGTIEYRSHVQTYGWQDWVVDDQITGTTGLAKRLEAIQFRLTGELAVNFDVVYRAYVENLGWLDWAKNGESAGSASYGYRMEAIEVRIVPKGAYSTGPKSYVTRNLQYAAHVQTYGWQSYRYDSGVSGTIGEGKRLEAITLSLINLSGLPDVNASNSGISYRTHIQTVGWEAAWKINGQISGTTGLGLRLEAIQIALTGDIANQYDVIYRVHVQHFGWLDWAKNGESAGSEGYGYRMEAIEIRLIPRGSLATDPTGAFKSI
ncbi:MAG: polysaccharide deacetylase family protein [Erysipelotrichaceae bacterium]|nr:polysaccharide deacetylase family protein [Erysipelotrichaceae bacterium]